jgi:hypothetical protein
MTTYKIILRSTNEVFFSTTNLIQLEGVMQKLEEIGTKYTVVS